MLDSAPRVIGTEIEFGIACPDAPLTSPILTSTVSVMAYAASIGLGPQRTRWDYEPESPLRDTRGFDLRRYHSAPVVDPNAMGAANLILPNGARFYVDHAHPEYSCPEITDPFDAVIWEKAGEKVMLDAIAAATAEGFGPNNEHLPLKVYKNNVDGKGASYGAHENYVYSRDIDLDTVHQALIPFFATRQIFCGAGRVGLGQRSEQPGFQISQRADYIETTVSLETTLNRGIINTRDEPHAAADTYRRLHVIIGDANLSEYAIALKVGTTALVLDAIEAGVDFSDLALEDPVAAVHTISRDLTLQGTVRLDDRKQQLTALEIQREYWARIMAAAQQTEAPGATRLSLSPSEVRVMQLWKEILDDLDADPLSTADRLDWTAKLALLERYRKGGAWDQPVLSLIDLQYSDIDPAKSLYAALVRKGAMKTLVAPEDIAAAVDTPPASTRAWARGRMIQRFPQEIAAASWDHIVLHGTPMQTIHLATPTTLAAAESFEIIEQAASARDVVAQIKARNLAEVTDL